ncbi:hypothetical protein G7Z17_g4468 [Cylindrodendrum hubeiense]|uniref:Inosine/uridine-preferring nucleoside hydrolase domain-containing protein n=1 Tax=Cylindrodendrum hubeiense TaxID=595255 RepID=A0A9P5LIW0_9HYPO|nr:hypothetical protein G7Z17_g4468 [Cylindrodendrum hubeiense]
MAQQSPARVIIDTDPGCLRNTVTLFDVLAKERAWRRSRGQDEGFEVEQASKPIVALGATEPISAVKTLAEYYHGRDGLGGTHSSHPHFTPPQNWKTLFESGSEASLQKEKSLNFQPSTSPSHVEMLRLLRESPPNTITIVAIGPLTNLALAAAEDQETFLKAKEIVIMGGAVDVCGNVTPAAEFNTYSDPHAAELIFSLTSPAIVGQGGQNDGLKVRLFPLDITVPHLLRKSQILPVVDKLVVQGSPLAEWVQAILGHTYQRVSDMYEAHEEDLGLSMHDPLCIWYVISRLHSLDGWAFSDASPEDIRVESDGKWTRGNRIWRVAKSPGTELFSDWMVNRIFNTE